MDGVVSLDLPGRRWTLPGVTFGVAQVFGATLASLFLLIGTGMTPVGFGVVVVTSLSTAVSVLRSGARRPISRSVAAFCVAGSLLLAGCARDQESSTAEVYALRDRTLPPGGNLVSFEGPHVDRHALRASWVVEAPMRWEDYAAWARPRFPQFRELERGRGRLLLSRPLEADQLLLLFEPKPSAVGTRVVVSFVGAPF